jgi:capsular exopolysaccharide synthesis family protein
MVQPGDGHLPVAQYAWERHALEPFVEDYRRLMTTILLNTDGPALSTVVFASPVARTGASTVASGFALTLARLEQHRVLLIDGNLRSPTLSRFFDVAPEPGLGDLVEGRCDFDAAIRATIAPRLQVMPAGSLRSSPLQIFTSDRFKAVLAEAARTLDCIIVDTAPVVGSAETLVLAAQVAGTVLVIRASDTRWEVVRAASERLRAARARVLGVVLNGRQSTIPAFVYRRI